MIKIFRFLAICTMSVALAGSSIAWTQTYTTVDYPGAIATTLNGGPNPQSTSVGSYTDTSDVTRGFVLTKKGVFTSFDPPGSTNTTPNFISPQGDIVGSYLDASTVSHGFILSGGNYTTVDFPGAAGTGLTGLNPSGELAGFSCVVASCVSGPFHSFVESKKGVFASFDPPGAISSLASTVNPSGAVVGFYRDSSRVGHGYLGATLTFNGGNNPEGDIVGEYVDTAGNGHGFLFNGAYVSFDLPGAIETDAAGINPGGIIVGIYVDSAGAVHGFIRTP
jgi:hypothetical protein